MNVSRFVTGVEAEMLARDPREKRVTLRLWNYWNGLRGRDAYPSLRDFRVEAVGDLSEHAFVVDFLADPGDPTLRFVGRALREEAGMDLTMKRLSAVPLASLLGQAAIHFDQVFSRGAPVGLQDEYVKPQGGRVLYRSVLLPFRGEGDAIDFIVGAITYRAARRGGA